MTTTRRLTFVTPRYGADVLGGAEAGARSLARRLAADGRPVSVITSCARSHVTWADEYPPGTTVEEGVTVHRFRVDRRRSEDFDESSARLLADPGRAERDATLGWIDAQGPTSAALVDAVAAVDEGAMIFYPYLYHPTVRGIPRAAVPTILYPAAHPEAPFALPIFDEVFGAVDGLAFHSRSEQDLVLSRFPATRTTPQARVGLPVDSPPDDVDGAATRARLGLGSGPFVLCLGRVDRGKGTHELARRFHDLPSRPAGTRLVLAGPIVDAPPALDGVVCVGPVSEHDKHGLLAEADVLVNPSPHESFSLVILEAWMAGTPVLVNGWCGPTTEHAQQSGGGLTYTGVADFQVALARLLDDAEVRARLGEAGRRYVEKNYSWPAVRARLDALVARVS